MHSIYGNERRRVHVTQPAHRQQKGIGVYFSPLLNKGVLFRVQRGQPSLADTQRPQKNGGMQMSRGCNTMA